MTPRSRKDALWLLFALCMLTVPLALILAKTCFIDNYVMPADGMYPGLPTGSHVFAVRRAYPDVSSVKRGDIVVFVQEVDGKKSHFIWRVVGLPGEMVEVYGASLIIDGNPAARRRLRVQQGYDIYEERIGGASYEVAVEPLLSHRLPNVSLTVPPDQFFLMGDNRSLARDSRYDGTVPFGAITGKKL